MKEQAIDQSPSWREILRQLERMLSNYPLASASTQSKMLKYIVDGTLKEMNGRSSALSEHEVGFAIFDNYDPQGSSVRTNATLLRSKIGEYYLEFGEQDLVRIEIPTGGYRARFTHNPTSEADILYRRGLLRLANYLPSKKEHSSLMFFKQAIKSNKKHAPAQAAAGEALLREAIYKRIQLRECLKRAESYASAALRIDKRVWRAHLVMGAIHCCRQEWDSAEKAFNQALKLSHGRTVAHSWYMAFRLAKGGVDEALLIARERCEDNPSDVNSHLALAFVLYVGKRFEEATQILGELISDRSPNWLAHLLYAYSEFASGSERSATRAFHNSYELLPTEGERCAEAIFPGGYLMNAIRDELHQTELATIAREELERVFQLDSRISGYNPEKEALRVAEGVQALFNAVAPWMLEEREGKRVIDEEYVAIEGTPRVPTRGDLESEIPYWTPLQVSIGYMAAGRKDMAIDTLKRALDEGDPLAMLLSVLPIFDELRGEPGFSDVIQKLAVPVHGAT